MEKLNFWDKVKANLASSKFQSAMLAEMLFGGGFIYSLLAGLDASIVGICATGIMASAGVYGVLKVKQNVELEKLNGNGVKNGGQA